MAGLVLLAGCGKVGNPLPPIVHVPETVDTMDVVQQGDDSILVLFPLPATAVREVAVLRRCGPPDETSMEPIARVDVSDLHRVPGGQLFAVEDPSPRFDLSCAYAVQFRDLHGHRSKPSNLVATQPGPVPSSPTDLSVEVHQSRIDVFWQPPRNAKGILGYLVDFREFVTESHAVIRDFHFGEQKTVVVQSVGRLQKPLILSPPTAVLSFVPKDTFAPPVPSGLTAVSVGGGVQLVWDGVTASDLGGYNVYRHSESQQEFKKIAGPLLVPRFFDPVEEGGSVLYYVVTAVDRNGNESGDSNEAVARLKP